MRLVLANEKASVNHVDISQLFDVKSTFATEVVAVAVDCLRSHVPRNVVQVIDLDSEIADALRQAEPLEILQTKSQYLTVRVDGQRWIKSTHVVGHITGSIADAAPDRSGKRRTTNKRFYASARGMKDEGVPEGPLRQMLC